MQYGRGARDEAMTLRGRALDPAWTPAGQHRPTVGDVVIGGDVDGAPGATDCLWEGRYSDPWRLVVASEATLTLDLTSSRAALPWLEATGGRR